MTDEDLSNTTIRRFDITRLIARGGMGEVYLAKDAVLGRDLALKILRQDVTRDSDRLERFVLEARAASALNHPHLIAIYDIGESSPKRNGSPVGPPVLYIAMELVSGETLRRSIEANRLDLDRTLEFMAQVADALDAAHAAGVTHRDLKPENLMIAEGGYAKVLDFGIAKLRADPMQNRTEAGQEPTATEGGRLLGTLGYMSPEQVQGQPTDYRTDVFSFGCVLYEAITGKRAFLGPNAFATLKEIVEREPAPLSTLVPSVPEGLERIVRTCLAKDPTQRYGSMREVAADLREVRRKMNDTAVVEVPRRENRRSFVMAAVAFVLVAAVLAVWWMNRRLPTATGSSGRVSIERLTTTGTAIDAAISPDGRQLAWVESAGGMQGLRLRHLDQGQTIELVPAAAVGYWGISFTPDGSRVFYATKSAQNPAGRLFEVSVQGGPSTPVLDGIDSTTAFSRDGRRIAFYRAGFPEPGKTSLVTARHRAVTAFARSSVCRRRNSSSLPSSRRRHGRQTANGYRPSSTTGAAEKRFSLPSMRDLVRSRSSPAASAMRRSRRGCPMARGSCSLRIRPTNSESIHARCGISRIPTASPIASRPISSSTGTSRCVPTAHRSFPSASTPRIRCGGFRCKEGVRSASPRSATTACLASPRCRTAARSSAQASEETPSSRSSSEKVRAVGFSPGKERTCGLR